MVTGIIGRKVGMTQIFEDGWNSGYLLLLSKPVLVRLSNSRRKRKTAIKQFSWVSENRKRTARIVRNVGI